MRTNFTTAGGLLAALMMVSASATTAIAADIPVTAVQETLKREQFFYGEPSGVLDEPTRAALRRFQIRYGLPVSGEIDAATVKALQGASAPSANAAPTAPPTSPKSAPQVPAAATAEKDREFLNDLQQSGTPQGPRPGMPPSAPVASPAAARASETADQDVVGTGTARIVTPRRGVIEDDTTQPSPQPVTPGETARRPMPRAETDEDIDPLAPNGVRIIRPPAPGTVPAPNGPSRVVEQTRTTTTTTTPAPTRAPGQGTGLPIYPQADEPPSRLVPETPSRKPQGFFQRLFRGDR